MRTEEKLTRGVIHSGYVLLGSLPSRDSPSKERKAASITMPIMPPGLPWADNSRLLRPWAARGPTWPP